MNRSRFSFVVLAISVALSQLSCADNNNDATSEVVSAAESVAEQVSEASSQTASNLANDVADVKAEVSSKVDDAVDTMKAVAGEHDGHDHSSTSEADTASATDLVDAREYVAGEHYQILDNPKKITAPDQIEVMEIFWYGCSHCFAFEPLIHKWQESVAKDVVLLRTPAVWRPIMKVHANVYYAAEALKLPQAIHTDIFMLLAKDQRLDDQKIFAKAFAKYGVEEEAYLNTYNSFAVKGKVSQAGSRAKKHYQTSGTPEIVVNGKYRVSGRMAGSQVGMLAVANYLIELERNAQSSPAG